MCTSLYAVGTTVIEIGRYGLSLDAARCRFVDICEFHRAEIRRIHSSVDRVVFDLARNEACHALIYAIADVAEIRGDPPIRYILRTVSAAPGEYLKTGTFSD